MSRSPERAVAAERLFPWVAAALFCWLVGWLLLSWPYMLDDALIHLRYADHLLHQGRITYDGVHDSFGTSSLLYVSLLAALRSVWTSPLLPRVVSTLVYLVFFVLLAGTLTKGLRGAERLQSGFLWTVASALLAVVVAPSAVRWLDDGMETGLVFLVTLAGFDLWRRLSRTTQVSAALLIWAVVYGFLTVLLRVELLVLVACVSATVGLEMFYGRLRRMGVEHPLRGSATAAAPLAGGLLAALTIRLVMGSLLPDTALAKAFGASAWQSTLQMTAVTVASSFSFGMGLIFLWLLSLIALALAGRLRLPDAPGNALFPLLLVLSAVRGQQIQGIRYFGWAVLFPLLGNLYRLAAPGWEEPPRREGWRLLQGAAALLCLALLPAFGWESLMFSRLFHGRVDALNTFRGQDLRGLRGQRGIAEDVGFVGYFTEGDICDPYGLVNGRALARLDYTQRFNRCMAQHPVFAFGSREFLQKVKFQQSLEGWFVCGSYPFNNVRTRDLHFLVVAPGLARSACPSGAVPLEEGVPHLL